MMWALALLLITPYGFVRLSAYFPQYEENLTLTNFSINSQIQLTDCLKGTCCSCLDTCFVLIVSNCPWCFNCLGIDRIWRGFSWGSCHLCLLWFQRCFCSSYSFRECSYEVDWYQCFYLLQTIPFYCRQSSWLGYHRQECPFPRNIWL